MLFPNGVSDVVPVDVFGVVVWDRLSQMCDNRQPKSLAVSDLRTKDENARTIIAKVAHCLCLLELRRPVACPPD